MKTRWKHITYGVLSLLAAVGSIPMLCYLIATCPLNVDHIRKTVAARTHIQENRLRKLGVATQSSGGALFECDGETSVPEGWFELPAKIPDSDLDTQFQILVHTAKMICNAEDETIDWEGQIHLYCPPDGDTMVFMRIGSRSFVLWTSLK